jgi:uncharacterized delta-60 repeat protein
VTGNHENGDSSDIVVARYFADGTLDESFGTAEDGTPNGVVNISTGDGDDTASDIAVQTDGSIVVAGTNNDGSDNITLLRLTKDGTLDEGFGTADDGTINGVVNTSLGDGDDTATALVLQEDGKILVTGNHENGDSSDIVVARYLN